MKIKYQNYDEFGVNHRAMYIFAVKQMFKKLAMRSTPLFNSLSIRNVISQLLGLACSIFIATTAAAGGNAEQQDPPSQNQVQLDEKSLLKGKRAFFKCRSCHTLKPGEPSLAGPNLAGFFGKPAGTNTDFNYTTALATAELKWDRETLTLWLQNPGKLVEGNKMVFSGLNDDAEIAALIEYLIKETAE